MIPEHQREGYRQFLADVQALSEKIAHFVDAQDGDAPMKVAASTHFHLVMLTAAILTFGPEKGRVIVNEALTHLKVKTDELLSPKNPMVEEMKQLMQQRVQDKVQDEDRKRTPQVFILGKVGEA